MTPAAVVGEMLPAVAGEGLAEFCDVFCETGVFSVAESERVLQRALDLGLGLKVHADELTPLGGAELARFDCVGVTLSLTTLDHKLSSLLEPRASRPARRLAAIRLLAEAGVPVGYLQAPMIPGLTDAEAPAIALAAKQAGATFCGYVALRLPFAVKALFEKWLEQHYPEKRQKVLNRVREIRGGRLNDPNFATRMRGHRRPGVRSPRRLERRGGDGPSPRRRSRPGGRDARRGGGGEPGKLTLAQRG